MKCSKHSTVLNGRYLYLLFSLKIPFFSQKHNTRTFAKIDNRKMRISNLNPRKVYKIHFFIIIIFLEIFTFLHRDDAIGGFRGGASRTQWPLWARYRPLPFFGWKPINSSFSSISRSRAEINLYQHAPLLALILSLWCSAVVYRRYIDLNPIDARPTEMYKSRESHDKISTAISSRECPDIEKMYDFFNNINICK